jgi:hypothetical protein
MEVNVKVTVEISEKTMAALYNLVDVILSTPKAELLETLSEPANPAAAPITQAAPTAPAAAPINPITQAAPAAQPQAAPAPTAPLPAYTIQQVSTAAGHLINKTGREAIVELIHKQGAETLMDLFDNHAANVGAFVTDIRALGAVI